jgi:hypothetical protein
MTAIRTAVYEIYDAWEDKVVARGMSYREAKEYIEKNEPPLNARVGFRYTYWRDRLQEASN